MRRQFRPGGGQFSPPHFPPFLERVKTFLTDVLYGHPAYEPRSQGFSSSGSGAQISALNPIPINTTLVDSGPLPKGTYTFTLTFLGVITGNVIFSIQHRNDVNTFTIDEYALASLSAGQQQIYDFIMVIPNNNERVRFGTYFAQYGSVASALLTWNRVGDATILPRSIGQVIAQRSFAPIATAPPSPSPSYNPGTPTDIGSIGGE